MQTFTNSYKKPSAYDGRIARRKTVIYGMNAGPVALSFVGIALLFLVGVGYLYIENHLTTRGYEVRDLEKQVEALKEQNKKLEIQSAQSRSIEELQKSATQKLNMVDVASVHYLERTNSTVALQILKP